MSTTGTERDAHADIGPLLVRSPPGSIGGTGPVPVPLHEDCEADYTPIGTWHSAQDITD